MGFPIRGSTVFPAALNLCCASQKSSRRRKENKLLADQQRLRDRNVKAQKTHRRPSRLQTTTRTEDAQKNQAAGLVGAGFPLLFGGGPALSLAVRSVVPLAAKNSASNSASALSARQHDRLIGSARNLGNAFSSVDETLKQVQQIGFNVNRATEKRVQLLVEEGRATEAFLLILERTGITAQQVQNLRELDTAFDELQDSFAKLFVTLASELTPAIVVISNLITEFVKALQTKILSNTNHRYSFRQRKQKLHSSSSEVWTGGRQQGYENCNRACERDQLQTLQLSTQVN